MYLGQWGPARILRGCPEVVHTPIDGDIGPRRRAESRVGERRCNGHKQRQALQEILSWSHNRTKGVRCVWPGVVRCAARRTRHAETRGPAILFIRGWAQGSEAQSVLEARIVRESQVPEATQYDLGSWRAVSLPVPSCPWARSFGAFHPVAPSSPLQQTAQQTPDFRQGGSTRRDRDEGNGLLHLGTRPSALQTGGKFIIGPSARVLATLPRHTHTHKAHIVAFKSPRYGGHHRI